MANGDATSPAADATLKDLGAEPGVMIPSFWGGRTSFSLAVRSGMAEVAVRVSPSQATAKITVAGQAAPTGGGVVTVPVGVGRTVVVVEVTAPDGQTRKSYELKVCRPPALPNWERLTAAQPWAARDSAGQLVLHDQMWLLGGYLPELVSDVWRSADGVNWTKVGEVPDTSGVNIPVQFAFAGRLWVTAASGQFWSSADGQRWELVLAKPPWGTRYGAGCVVFQERLWVLGGAGGGLHHDVWSSADGREWRLETAHADWSPRQLFGNVVVLGERLFVIGGGISQYQPFKAYRDVWSSTDGRHWELVCDEAPWPARIWSDCLVYRERLWLFSGFRAQPTWNNFNDVWYSRDGATWEKLETEDIWEPRHEVSPLVFQGAIWLLGGNAWPLKNDVWRLAIAGLSWLSQPVLEEIVHAEYRYHARADFHLGGGAVKYALAAGPPWLTLNTETGLLRGPPAALGDYPITLTATAGGETITQSYTLSVIPA